MSNRVQSFIVDITTDDRDFGIPRHVLEELILTSVRGYNFKFGYSVLCTEKSGEASLAMADLKGKSIPQLYTVTVIYHDGDRGTDTAKIKDTIGELLEHHEGNRNNVEVELERYGTSIGPCLKQPYQVFKVKILDNPNERLLNAGYLERELVARLRESHWNQLIVEVKLQIGFAG